MSFYNVSCYFFLIIELYFLIKAIIVQIFIVAKEFTIPTGIATKEAKAEFETHSVRIKATFSTIKNFTKPFVLLTY